MPIFQVQTSKLGSIEDYTAAMAADTSHDVTFTFPTGFRILSDNAEPKDRIWFTVATLTKQIDAVWAVGTNAGCLDTGSPANNTYYGYWAIYRSDTGVSDIICVAGNGSPSMPANYTHKAFLKFDVYTDGSANIRPWIKSYNRITMTGSGITALSTTTPAATPTAVRAICPIRNVNAFVQLTMLRTGFGVTFVGLNSGNVYSHATRRIQVSGVANDESFTIPVDTSGNFYYQVDSAVTYTTFVFYGHGWEYN